MRKISEWDLWVLDINQCTYLMSVKTLSSFIFWETKPFGEFKFFYCCYHKIILFVQKHDKNISRISMHVFLACFGSKKSIPKYTSEVFSILKLNIEKLEK